MEENRIPIGFVIAAVAVIICVAALAVHIVTNLDWDSHVRYGTSGQAVTEAYDTDEILREWKDEIREDMDDGF